MGKLIKVELDENTSIYMQSDDNYYGEEIPIAGQNKTIVKRKILDKWLDGIVKYSDCVLKKIRETSLELDEVEIEFSTSLDMEHGFVLLNSKLEAGMNVKIKWKKDENNEEKEK